METLVLSPAYEPIARVPWQRAITLLWIGKVEVLEQYEDQDVRAVTFSLKMPSVVRFLRGLRRKPKVVRFSRENVYARDGGRCQYCARKIPRHESTYDHVVPRAQGGRTTWENVVIACVACNQRKGGRTPEQARMRLATVPARPKKLPDAMRLTLTWSKAMPDSWKGWVRDYAYWNTELDSE